MKAGNDAGLTLLELLIVVALLSIIAAFALPRLLRARMVANESAAIASLRAVGVSQDLFAKFCGGGGYSVALTSLGLPAPGGGAPFLAPDLTASDTPEKSGYTFGLAAGAGATGGPTDCHGKPTATRFYATAVPAAASRGRRSFALTTNQGIWQVAGSTAPPEPFGPPATPIP